MHVYPVSSVLLPVVSYIDSLSVCIRYEHLTGFTTLLVPRWLSGIYCVDAPFERRLVRGFLGV